MPLAAISDAGRRDKQKGKDTDNQPEKGKSPCGTSYNSQANGPSESVDDTMNDEGYHVVISDDEDGGDVEEMTTAAKRKLTSKVWADMKKLKVNEVWKAKCNYCYKQLSTTSKNDTIHLCDHLKICTLKMLKTKGGKSTSQTSMRLNAQEDGNVSMENYTFDQEIARQELGNMLVLYEYPLSMLNHVGFRRFVAALQPLFRLYIRNTIKRTLLKDITLKKDN